MIDPGQAQRERRHELEAGRFASAVRADRVPETRGPLWVGSGLSASEQG